MCDAVDDTLENPSDAVVPMAFVEKLPKPGMNMIEAFVLLPQCPSDRFACVAPIFEIDMRNCVNVPLPPVALEELMPNIIQ